MPYFYLYDSYLQDKNYSNQLIRLETALTDLGLQGKIGRLTLLKSIRDLIDSALRDNSDTIVVVGNDITFSQTAEIVAKYPKITLGFIPLGQDRQILASLLGIPVGLLACHTLSSRITKQIDVGKINNQFFIQSVAAQGRFNLECESHYRLSTAEPHNLKICNLDLWGEPKNNHSNPADNLLEIILTPQKDSSWLASFKKQPALQPTILPLKNLLLEASGDNITLLVDGHKVLKTPATVTVANEKLKIIVGRGRYV